VISISVSINTVEDEKSEGHTFHLFSVVLLYALIGRLMQNFRHFKLACLKYSGNLMIFPYNS